MEFETEILIPHIIYQKDPIRAIKSKLGNDVELISYTTSDALTTNEEFIVKVVYKSVDFSPFELYKVKNVKRLNTNSDKYIGEIDEIPKTYVKLNANVKECFVKLNTLTQNNVDNDIIYYGDIISSVDDITSNFCSAFSTTKLSYHGSKIEINIPKNQKLKDITKIKLTQNQFSDKDKKLFDEFQSMSHEYSRNYFDIGYLKQQISNKINILSPDSIIKNNGLYSAENLTIEELSSVLKQTKNGILFMLARRTLPYYFVYIQNHETVIKPHLIEHMLIIMAKDIENINKFMK